MSVESPQLIKNRAVTGVKWTGLAQLLLFFVQLIQVGVLARYLDPKDFGNMALLLIVINVLHAFSDLGMGNSLIAGGEFSKSQLSNVYWVGVFSGSLLTLIIFSSSGFIAGFFSNPALASPLKWISPYFLLISFSQPFMALLQKQLKFKTIASCEIMGSLLGLVFAVWAAMSGLGLMSLVGGYMVIIAVRSLAVIMLRPVNIGYPVLKEVSGISGHLRFGSFQLGERVINVFRGQVDKALLGKFLGIAELGYYSIAMQLALRPVMLLSPVLMKVGFPVLSQVSANRDQVRKAYMDIMKFVSFMGAPLYVGLFVMGTPLMELWLGPGWEHSHKLFKILVFIGLSVALGNPAGSLLLALKKPGLSFAINVFGFATNLISILIGVQWGAEGIAYMLLLNNSIVMFSIDYWIGIKYLNISIVQFTGIWLPNLLRSIAMGLGVWYLGVWLQMFAPVFQLAVLFISGILLYFGINLLTQREYMFELKRRLLSSEIRESAL